MPKKRSSLCWGLQLLGVPWGMWWSGGIKGDTVVPSSANTQTLQLHRPQGGANCGCHLAPKQSFPLNFSPDPQFSAPLPKVSKEF